MLDKKYTLLYKINNIIKRGLAYYKSYSLGAGWQKGDDNMV